jgi:hypothetical protein
MRNQFDKQKFQRVIGPAKILDHYYVKKSAC